MAHAQLGNYTFRLDPDQIKYDYKINYSVIDTLGGQVVQVLGATIGDLTIRGSFGQDHANARESWELAESFHAAIKAMMDAQTLPNQGAGGVSHQPIRFTYMDGVHDWDFHVLIKGISDPDGEGSIEHATGKFSYHYVLTLFIVSDDTLKLRTVETDKFIARVSNGLGWKKNVFNGSASLNDAIAFIQGNSPDGSFQGYLINLLENGSGSTTTTPTGPGGGSHKLN